jgi:valyl-tRNA synthetase
MDRQKINLPEKPALEGLEAKWTAKWEADGTYRFEPGDRPRDQIYSIDTPPPTVSGSLHVGHVFSYTHTDVIRAISADARQGRAVSDGLGR